MAVAVETSYTGAVVLQRVSGPGTAAAAAALEGGRVKSTGTNGSGSDQFFKSSNLFIC